MKADKQTSYKRTNDKLQAGKANALVTCSLVDLSL